LSDSWAEPLFETFQVVIGNDNGRTHVNL
jgi:hypothetical protein